MTNQTLQRYTYKLIYSICMNRSTSLNKINRQLTKMFKYIIIYVFISILYNLFLISLSDFPDHNIGTYNFFFFF